MFSLSIPSEQEPIFRINQHPSKEPELQLNSSTSMIVSVRLSFQSLVEKTSPEIFKRFFNFEPSELPTYWIFENCKNEHPETISPGKYRVWGKREIGERAQ